MVSTLTPPLPIRSEKSQNESSPNFSNSCPGFCPEFLSEFLPNFLRIFRASFCGKRRPEKIHQKSPPFLNAKFPGKYGKKKIPKCFWRGGKVTSKAQSPPSQCLLQNPFGAPSPKGPFRTKNSTESKFATARKKRYGNSKTLRRLLRSACFSRKERQENGPDSKKLRR